MRTLSGVVAPSVFSKDYIWVYDIVVIYVKIRVTRIKGSVEGENTDVRVYLDNCSYNRPYDDQSQMRIHLETQAKIHIQDMIREKG